MIVLGADTHKRSHSLAVVDTATGQLLADKTIRVGTRGFASAAERSDRRDRRRSRGAGRGNQDVARALAPIAHCGAGSEAARAPYLRWIGSWSWCSLRWASAAAFLRRRSSLASLLSAVLDGSTRSLVPRIRFAIALTVDLLVY